MGDLLGELPSMNWFFWLMGIAIGLILVVAIYAQYQEYQTVYEMPNGVICELRIMHGGGVFSSGSTFEFRDCEDGEKYINPKSFLEIKK